MVKKLLLLLDVKNFLKFENLGWYFIILTSIILGQSGYEKIIGSELAVMNFKILGIDKFTIHFGILELLLSILILIPRTSLFGVVLISVLMIGQIILNIFVAKGVGVYSPIIILLLTWMGYYLRKNGIYTLIKKPLV